MIRRGVLWAVVLGLAGCTHPQQARLQSADERDEAKEVRVETVGDKTQVANVDPIPVAGLGLVTGLDGTGGPAANGPERATVEEYLKKRGVENVKELLNSPECAVVRLVALVPPGARKGDPIDVEVTIPPGSRATSLRGGYLEECTLHNFDSKKNLSPNYAGRDSYLKGHPLVKAKGPVLVAVRGEAEAADDGDGRAGAVAKVGRVWGGGRSLVEPPLLLTLNLDQQFARVAAQIAARANATFHGPAHGREALAAAQNNRVVSLAVPPQYRLNLPRYLRVVRAIPLEQAATADGPYRRQLAEQLLDPAQAVVAAIRLEALGVDSVPTLKAALKSPCPLVRFAAAESLAYLGQGCSAEELARLADTQPVLRAYCLTALASLDEAVCQLKLQDLLAADAPEVRYGAFRALRVLNDRDPAVHGTKLNDSFWLHKVAPESKPMAHLLTGRRPEVVLFGAAPELVPPFSFLVGPEYTVTATKGDTVCTISRFSTKRGMERRQCPLSVEEVLKNLAELGGTYPDAADLLRQADRTRALSCPLHFDALPQAPAVQDLAQMGTDNPDLLPSAAPAADATATPGLFETGKDKIIHELHE